MDASLARLGFTPAPGGYARGDWQLAVGPQWCVLHAPGSESPDDWLAGLGTPGLWKLVRAGESHRKIFALPRRVWDAVVSADADNETNVLEQTLRWALDSAEASSSPEWQAPSRALVESWFAAEALTVAAGTLLRQGELICEPDRLALRFPLAPEIPEALPESRAAWLRLLLEETHERWHLVRVGFLRDDADALNAVAEVDLTGVPHELAEDLFAVSLEALRWVVTWLGETTDGLADATVASELLAVCPNPNT
jgi:hypothetical protein